MAASSHLFLAILLKKQDGQSMLGALMVRGKNSGEIQLLFTYLAFLLVARKERKTVIYYLTAVPKVLLLVWGLEYVVAGQGESPDSTTAIVAPQGTRLFWTYLGVMLASRTAVLNLVRTTGPCADQVHGNKISHSPVGTMARNLG